MKRYVPKLIPEKHRVLPDYFKESNHSLSNQAASAVNSLWNIMAIVVAIGAVIVLGVHPGFSLSLLLLAFFTSSWGTGRVERGLQFRFTPVIKAGMLGILSLTSILMGLQYSDRVDQAIESKRLILVAEQKASAAAQRKEALRVDSLRVYLIQANTALKKGAYSKAIGFYNQSARFATASESDEQQRIYEGLATSYVRTKQYRSAIQQYDLLSNNSTLYSEQLYQRALCYQSIGSKSEAISDLRTASEAGHKSASKLYEKLNPLIRKVLYYQTVCCDGSDSPSNAKGQGACSHHGGVCNWNKPIYETYRKYDRNGL